MMTDFARTIAVESLVDRKPSRVMVGETAIAVVTIDGEIFAVGDRCSHADVSLSEGDVEGCSLECWLHGSAFDLRTGAPLTLPAIEPVPVFATRVTVHEGISFVEINPTPLDTAKGLSS
jgi:3-phenylpropionate/trans-cinnamate dioxygenase ferredoxin subunit